MPTIPLPPCNKMKTILLGWSQTPAACIAKDADEIGAPLGFAAGNQGREVPGIIFYIRQGQLEIITGTLRSKDFYSTL